MRNLHKLGKSCLEFIAQLKYWPSGYEESLLVSQATAHNAPKSLDSCTCLLLEAMALIKCS